MTAGDALPVARVVVIVVTYKSDELAAEVGRTLSSFLDLSTTHYCATVENSGSAATTDALHRELCDQASRHLHLQPSKNVGFSPAVNTAYAAARQRWGPFDLVVLLNPDVIADGHLIAEVVAKIEADPTVGIGAPVLVSDDGRVDRGTARRRWTPLTLFAEVAGFGEHFARGTRLSRYIPPQGSSALDVDITSGAFMAVRTTVLQDRGLDTRLPLYLEDQEICHRAHMMGYRVTVFPELVARHIGGVSRTHNTESQRSLRCMELATAPAMSMHDWSAVPMTVARLTVGVAATARIAAATAALTQPRRRDWARSQIQLGRWLLAWAVRPKRWGQTL